MRIVWSLPVRGETLSGHRGDLVRARNLIAALRDCGHQVEVIESSAVPGAVAAVGGYRDIVRRLLPGPVALVLRDLGRYLHGRAHGRHVGARAVTTGAELVIETQVGFAPSAAEIARRTHLPVVLDDTSPTSEEIEQGAGLPALARRALARNARAASTIVVTTTEISARLRAEGLPGERIVVVPNGAVPSAPLGRDERSAIRRELGLGERELAVVFAGSFHRWHGLPLLLDAVAELGRRAQVRLVMFGEGPERDPALARARALGIGHLVRAPGAVEHGRLRRLLAAFDVGVLPASNDYGEPMKLYDYAAAGLAIVAPEIRTVKDLVEDGRGGLLFTPGSSHALALALARAARDEGLRRRLGEQARTRLAREASWRARAARLIGAATGNTLAEADDSPGSSGDDAVGP